jgi:hypothetical protein
VSRTTVDDRRAHPRHDAEINLQGSTGPGVVARMISRNLSLGGLYCTSTADFPEMTRLAVRLLLPVAGAGGDVAPLDLEAVVVRREELPAANGDRRFDLALFFTNIEPTSRERLRRYLISR